MTVAMDNKNAEKNSSVISLDSYNNTSSRLKLTDVSYPDKKSGKTLNTVSTENDYNPFNNRDKTHATSTMGAVLHMLKSSLGSGILAMPHAFRNGGLIFGIFGTVIAGFICTHCVQVLVYCSQVLSTRVKKPSLGFAETVQVAFETGPPKYRFWAPFAREFVHVTLFCTYFFGNTVYVIFISNSFEQVIENHFHNKWDLRIYILLLTIPLLPLGIIRTLKYLVPFSAIATVFVMFGLALTLYYTFTDIPDITTRDYIATPLRIPIFFSTVLFAMEGIGTVLPIENSMKHPEKFLGCPGVLNTAMTVVVALYATVGFFGYLRFGEKTYASVTLNLPNEVFGETVKILVALSVLLTYGLQFTVPSEIVWKRLGPKLSEDKQEIGYYIMRGIMILGTVASGVALPSMPPFISLIGAICFSLLGLFIPSLLEIITFYEDGYGRFQWRFIKNVILIFISIFSLVSGSYASVLEIIAFYQHDGH
ncbi:proton-coupled amino acid transporter-like protein pathetic [Lycorma delicatula]|uniref:proton-coupled amino acid transporter-like protein pathetic n=1 Tax=Lycorma delicatula TaxID=130591 RepID=UPI003F51169C